VKKIYLALVVVFAVSLVAPAGALATDIGSTSGVDFSDPDGLLPCTDTTGACIQTQEKIAGDGSINVVPADGRIITAFKFRGTGTLALRILRDNGSTIADVGGTVNVTSPSAATASEYTTHVPVQPNDFIGLRLGPSSSIGVLNGGAGTNAWELGESGGWPPIDSAEPYELLLEATVEPDRDGDGLGDDSEDPDGGFPDTGGGSEGGGSGGGTSDGGDGSAPATPAPDPLAPLRAGKRPTGKILGKSYKVSKKGVVKVKVKNTNGFTIKGKLTLKAKRLVIGAKSFKIGADSSKYVRVKLRRKARTRLARKRRMSVKATAKFRGPIGKSRTIKKKLTLKAPKRAKKRSSGGGTPGTTTPGTGINPCGLPTYEPGYTDSYGIFHPGQMNYCPGLY
jgi:hypothetical protein